ncbi:hypothetical protein [Stenotrophomonas maltophilia]|jgi:hypothetical protein|uniref:hypothetical protein n=1 Tax=Stenotrophomonas maltophilia TaxID=40324 RepID=UPI000B032E1A|nr:hypothetical protein [Stenotrophomonas maltophilia]PWI03793.1 hypothetical protein DI494_03455 [Stenotrophomonas maltophilia]
MRDSVSDEIGLPPPKWWQRLWVMISSPKKVYPFTFLLGCVLILFYLIIPHLLGFEANWSLSFVKELGFAYVIAAILGFSIEAFNHARHLLHEKTREAELEAQGRHLVAMIEDGHSKNLDSFGNKVAKDVIEAAYGVTVPKEVLNALSQFVLQARRIRREFSISIDIQLLDRFREERNHVYSGEDERAKDAKRVALTYSATWEDENVLAGACDLPIPVEIVKEGPMLDGVVGLKLFSAKIDGEEGDFRAESVEGLRKLGIDVDDDQEKLQFCYTVKGLPSRSRARFSLKHVTVQDINDEIIVMSLPPCVNIELAVQHGKGLDVVVSSMHSEKAIELPASALWKEGERRWKLATASLPSQGFVVTWKPV